MLYALLALMTPLWDRTATPGEVTDASVSRLLLVAAAALAAVLAILLVDLHHDELRALGLSGDAASISAIFLGP
jgi:hypothetical protein